MIAVVMGVSGAGKSAIGAALARELGWLFIDADDYHPQANVAKMAAGQPLDDDDRWPWLDRLNAVMKEEKDAVVACSALKERYRQRLARGIEQIEWVWLRGDFELIRSRLLGRQHRYMPASLLESQFAALEPPAYAIAVDVSADVSACVGKILAELSNRTASR
ncbi:MAG TPA: gluconokinase [Burkholderiales bacterium]|jgi:gluconokinase|nr:gluconokinase [Burkholderiales bacterium]